MSGVAYGVAYSSAGRGRFPVAEKAARTVDGIVFDSKKEATRYAELRLLVRANEITDLTRQHELKASIAGAHFCKLTVDFRYKNSLGVWVYEEIKSDGTAKDTAYRLRKKAVELSNDIRITEVII